MTTIRRLVAYGAATGATLGAILVAAPAYAGPTSTIDSTGGEIHFVAGDGQANHVLVTELYWPAHTYRFDDVHPIVVSPSACTYPDPSDSTMVDCVEATTITVSTGDLDDVIDVRPAVSWRLDAGEGGDTIRTGAGPGLPGNRTDGGPGDDTIVSGPGSEHISGGPGIDTVSYVGRWTAVTASVSGGGGSAGETDTYDGIENVVGGAGADALTGDGAPNLLDGGYAASPCLPFPLRAEVAEVLAAPAAPRTDREPVLAPCLITSGDDILDGGDGADLLFGRGGDDTLVGGPGYDTVDGGPGTGDFCHAGADGEVKVDCELPGFVKPTT